MNPVSLPETAAENAVHFRRKSKNQEKFNKRFIKISMPAGVLPESGHSPQDGQNREETPVSVSSLVSNY